MQTSYAMAEKPPTGESHRVLLAVGNVAEGDSLAGWLGYEGFDASRGRRVLGLRADPDQKPGGGDLRARRRIRSGRGQKPKGWRRRLRREAFLTRGVAGQDAGTPPRPPGLRQRANPPARRPLAGYQELRGPREGRMGGP